MKQFEIGDAITVTTDVYRMENPIPCRMRGDIAHVIGDDCNLQYWIEVLIDGRVFFLARRQVSPINAGGK